MKLILTLIYCIALAGVALAAEPLIDPAAGGDNAKKGKGKRMSQAEGADNAAMGNKVGKGNKWKGNANANTNAALGTNAATVNPDHPRKMGKGKWKGNADATTNAAVENNAANNNAALGTNATTVNPDQPRKIGKGNKWKGNANANDNAAVENKSGQFNQGRKGNWKKGGNNNAALGNNAGQFNQGQNKGKWKDGNKPHFQAKHFQLHGGPKQGIVSVQFNAGRGIEGSHNWKGQKYSHFQNYKSQWHDQGWWHQHHNTVILINGGWYYRDAGYWYPAWGYDSSAAYYPYDGPIYAPGDMDPGQVVANVQAALQEMGYYEGEVDGLLGPITRAALAAYQADNGLYTTSAIDEPTLESLGLG